ncbi:MAG: WG repeat-containing protein [Muribaculaceae bacterium]|nr:WG repeat-containing protein [Muribaculaceae bacterium]
MTKKCGKCGFMNNPGDAHYCGKCGNRLDYFSNWKVYNSTTHTAVENGTLGKYRRYEQQVKNSWLIDPWSKFKKWWEDSKAALGVTLGVGVGVIVITLVCSHFFSNGCSSSEKKPMSIEVDGKYGIGYDKDNLLVPAEYDSISDQPTGKNQWLIVDPATGLKGMAYVTDSIQNIIEPKYEDVSMGISRYSLLRTTPRTGYHVDEYEYVAKDGIIMNAIPFNAIENVGVFNDYGIFIDKQANGNYQLYSRNLEKIGSDFVNYSSAYTIADDGTYSEDVLVASGRYDKGCELYDFCGNKLNKSPLYSVSYFSDGLAWAYVTKNDYLADRLSVIDRYGIPCFSVNAKKYSDAVAYSEGIGWYQNPEGQWVAVDKKGTELFSLVACKVCPFTMGLAPAYRHTGISESKLGFVDKTGRTVIPFKYKSSEYRPRFLSDSTMTVTLDGKEGKLHRNGTFYPGK